MRQTVLQQSIAPHRPPLHSLPLLPVHALQMLQLCWNDYPMGRSIMVTAMGLGVVLKLWLG